MKVAKFQIKKTARVKVRATVGKVKIAFPKQVIGTVSLFLLTDTKKRDFSGPTPKAIYDEKLLRAFSLVLQGDKLTVEAV